MNCSINEYVFIVLIFVMDSEYSGVSNLLELTAYSLHLHSKTRSCINVCNNDDPSICFHIFLRNQKRTQSVYLYFVIPGQNKTAS